MRIAKRSRPAASSSGSDSEEDATSCAEQQPSSSSGAVQAHKPSAGYIAGLLYVRNEAEASEAVKLILQAEDEQIKELLRLLRDRWWCFAQNAPLPAEVVLSKLLKTLALDTVNLSDTSEEHGEDTIRPQLQRVKGMVITLYYRMKKLGMLQKPKYAACIHGIMKNVHMAMKMLLSLHSILATCGRVCELVPTEELKEGVGDAVEDENLNRDDATYINRYFYDFSVSRRPNTDNEGNQVVQDDVNKYQLLLLFLLNQAQENNYRRYGDGCYTPVLTPEGLHTVAWKRVCSIKEFVYKSTSKEFSFDMWVNLTDRPGNAASAIGFLSDCEDYQFPRLHKDRTLFSFRNGAYFAEHNRFMLYTDKTDGDKHVACKHFDKDFDPFEELEDWRDIPTPYMQSVLDYQEFPPEVQDWAYILMGRLLYQIDDWDGWQVIPFFKGVAGSGKSTLIKVAKGFFEAVDVGVLSNNVEKTFGLSGLVDKLLFVAPEIKSDLRIEQAEFQSMISGEDVQINTKHATARAVPAWTDNAGSVVRRIVLFEFPKKVVNGDMKLDKKLKDELPAILCKVNRAYLDVVKTQKKGQVDVWTMLPEYFRKTQKEMAETTNGLVNFLSSSAVLYGEDLYVPKKMFLARMSSHLKELNFPTTKLSKDSAAGPFQTYKLREDSSRARRRYPREDGPMLPGPFIIGCDFADEE